MSYEPNPRIARALPAPDTSPNRAARWHYAIDSFFAQQAAQAPDSDALQALKEQRQKEITRWIKTGKTVRR